MRVGLASPGGAWRGRWCITMYAPTDANNIDGRKASNSEEYCLLNNSGLQRLGQYEGTCGMVWTRWMRKLENGDIFPRAGNPSSKNQLKRCGKGQVGKLQLPGS
jgi:hypothetical protein